MSEDPRLADDSLIPPGEQDEIGHNSEEAAFRWALREQIKLDAEAADFNARRSKKRKEMKAKGVVLGKLDAVVKMLAWTPEEQRDDLDTLVRYMGYAGFSIGHLAEGEQGDLFGHTNDEDVAKADWYARGQADALRLKPAKIPDTCPPEHRDDYLKGYNDSKWTDIDAEADA